MNEMTPEEKTVYNELLRQISMKLFNNSTSYNISRLKEFVEVVNLRIEGSRYNSEWE